MSEQKRKTSTLEERREKLQEKLKATDRKIENRKVRKLWQSEFRKKKSELNKNKELDYVAKFQAFVDWVYDETEIFVEVEDLDLNDEEEE